MRKLLYKIICPSRKGGGRRWWERVWGRAEPGEEECQSVRHGVYVPVHHKTELHLHPQCHDVAYAPESWLLPRFCPIPCSVLGTMLALVGWTVLKARWLQAPPPPPTSMTCSSSWCLSRQWLLLLIFSRDFYTIDFKTMSPSMLLSLLLNINTCRSN